MVLDGLGTLTDVDTTKFSDHNIVQQVYRKATGDETATLDKRLVRDVLGTIAGDK